MKARDFDWDAWFNEKPRVTKKNPDKSDYVPIGIIEQDLDELDSWNTFDEQFSTFSNGKDTFVTNSIVLSMTFGDRSKSYVGGSTVRVNPNDPNQEYRGTLISRSISNAAKKSGARFGRELNGRMESGETELVPVIQLQHVRDLEKIEDYFNEFGKVLGVEDKKIFQRVIQNREVSSYQKLIKIIETNIPQLSKIKNDKQSHKKRKL